MNTTLKAILVYLINKRYIGEKHTPEEKLVKSRSKWLKKDELKEFKKEYKKHNWCFRRLKKRTGKGFDWHISIDHRCLQEIITLLKKKIDT